MLGVDVLYARPHHIALGLNKRKCIMFGIIEIPLCDCDKNLLDARPYHIALGLNKGKRI